MKTDKFTLFVYCNFLVLLRTVYSQNISKQIVNIADENLTDYSFLSRHHYTKSKNYLERRYRLRHWIPMFIGTPCSLKYDYMSKFKIGKSNILDLRISTAGKHVQELSEWNTFKTRKATASSTLLTRYRFQGYRCKSGIAIFAWRVTWEGVTYIYTLYIIF